MFQWERKGLVRRTAANIKRFSIHLTVKWYGSHWRHKRQWTKR